MVLVEVRLIDLGLNVSGDKTLDGGTRGDIMGADWMSSGGGGCPRGPLSFLIGEEVIELALIDFR